jgi:TPR repeat protein
MFKSAVRKSLLWALTGLLGFYAVKQFPGRDQVATSAYKNGEYVKAMKLWEKMAKNGDSIAQYNLGALLKSGVGTGASVDEAAKWFLKSAKNGNPAAQFEIGKIFEAKAAAGGATGLPAARALIWIKKSANQGYEPAEVDLGLKYLSGTGVDQNAERATYWLSQVIGAGRVPKVMLGGADGGLTALPCDAGNPL